MFYAHAVAVIVFAIAQCLAAIYCVIVPCSCRRRGCCECLGPFNVCCILDCNYRSKRRRVVECEFCREVMRGLRL